MALQSGYTLATESPFAWEVPHKIMVRLTHLDALCCIDWGGAKVGTGICTVIHLDLLLQVTWIACEPSWDLLCVGHSWGAHGTGLVRPIIQASPLTPYSQQMYKKNTIARMRPAILQWFQSILFFLASPAGAAAPRRSRGHVWPVTTSTRLKRSASVLPQMLGFNLGSGAFRDWSLGLPN